MFTLNNIRKLILYIYIIYNCEHFLGIMLKYNIYIYIYIYIYILIESLFKHLNKS